VNGARVLILNNTSSTIDSTFTDASGNWYYTFPATAIEEAGSPPANFYVGQNYPNPFNPSTIINFTIPEHSEVEILIHNILGELIEKRIGFLEAGSQSIEWKAKGSAGVYLFTVKSKSSSITKKMIQLDGGTTGGLSEFRKSSVSALSSSKKSSAYDIDIIISKFSFVDDTIKIEITGGEHFNSELTLVHFAALMVDFHNDILSVMASDRNYRLADLHSYHHTDIPRLKMGGVDVQLFAVYVSPSQFPNNPFNQAMEMINIFHEEMMLNYEDIRQSKNYDEIISTVESGKISAVLCVEGGHTIENDLNNLYALHNEGIRYMTITWNNSTDWAVSAQDSRSATVGLSDFGREVIRKMDSLGIIIDISHTGIKTIEDILEVTTNPIIASHSGVRALRNHYRNLYDDQIKAIAKSGGVIGVVFYPSFLSTNPSSVNINTVIQHIDYIVNLVGIDYVGIGSDFDGIETTPFGLEDASKFPYLTQKLLERGYSAEDVFKILGGNFMRVINQVTAKSKSQNLKRIVRGN
jgi:membrane dipeptidase